MESSVLFHVVWVAIHVVGLLAAWSVRQRTSGYRQALALGSFFSFTFLIAFLTIVGEVLCLELWPLSAATLGAMIVTAVVDFGSPTDVEPGHEH